MRQIGTLFLVVACAVAWDGRGPDAVMQDANAAHLALVSGTGNGLCCVVQGGASCETVPGVANCGAPLPWECHCTSPGAYCSVLDEAPKNHDICRSPKPPNYPNEETNCETTSVYCYTVKPGSCDDDAGPWSWGGFCFTCGCLVDQAAAPSPQGSRNVCVSGSTGC